MSSDGIPPYKKMLRGSSTEPEEPPFSNPLLCYLNMHNCRWPAFKSSIEAGVVKQGVHNEKGASQGRGVV